MVVNNFKENSNIIQVIHITNNYFNQPSPDKLPDKKEPKKKFDWAKVISGLYSVFKWLWKFILIFVSIDSS